MSNGINTMCTVAGIVLILAMISSCSAGLLYFDLSMEHSWSNGSFYSLADLNGDDIPDILSSDKTCNIYAWESNGNALEGWPIEVRGSVYGLASADINNDGKNEIIFGNSSGFLYVYNASGDLLWSRSVCKGSETFESEPVIEDIDGDGEKEIVLQCSSFMDSEVYVIDNEGGDISHWPVSLEGMLTGPLSVSDVDGDGKKEIVAVSSVLGGGSRIYILRSNASMFSEKWPQTVSGESFSHSPVAGDVDGEGEKEIVVAGQGWPSRVYVFEKNGSYRSWCVPATGKSSPIVLEDIDEDGAKEIITSWSGSGAGMFVWRGNGSLVWSYPTGDSSNSSERYSPLVKDFDGNGKKEVVMPAEDVLYVFSAEGRLLESITPEDFNGFDYDITSPRSGDVDGDGKEEVVFGGTRRYESRTYVYEAEAVEDTEAPTSRIYYAHNNSWVRHAQTLTLQEEDNLDPDPETLYCISDSFCAPNESINNGETITIDYEGVNYIVFNSTDESGFYNVFEAVVKIDWSIPELVVEGPENKTYNNTELDLIYTASDTISGISAVFYSIDGGESHAVSGNKTLTVGEGKHTLRMYAVDYAGNTKEHSVTFTCDTTAPETENVEVYASYFSAQVDIYANEESGMDVFYGENCIDLNSNSSDGIFGMNHSVVISGLEPGKLYCFYVRLCDSAGNCNSTHVFNFTTLECDSDGDGYNSLQCGGNDCNDKERNIHPGAGEICGNGIDEDCSGSDLKCSSPAPPSSNGGGGGGGGYTPPVTSETAYASTTWVLIDPENPAEMEINKEELAVYEIRINVKERVTSAELKVKAVRAVNGIERPSGKVYQFFEIEHRNIEEKNIEKSYIAFSVNRTWIEGNNIDKSSVVLMRHHNDWEELETRIVKQDEEKIYYEAESPGFSYFAVTGREKKSTETVRKENICGDGNCLGNETCHSCPDDCGACPAEEGNRLVERDKESAVSSGNITGRVSVDVAVYCGIIVVFAGALVVYAKTGFRRGKIRH